MLSQTTKETEQPHSLMARTPTGTGAEPASGARAPGADTARRRKGRVLLVEDEIDLVTSLSYSLEAAGYQVQSALDGTTALQLAAGQPPDIVLLDLMLPDISGLEVCRRIRASSQTHQPIVIMVTARGEEVDRVGEGLPEPLGAVVGDEQGHPEDGTDDEAPNPVLLRRPE